MLLTASNLEDGSDVEECTNRSLHSGSHVARARKFYEGKVGLKPKEEYTGGLIYECGSGSWVFVYPSAGAGTSKASTAFWAVKDVAAEVAELKARGVVFEEYDMPGIKIENSIAMRGQRENCLVQG